VNARTLGTGLILTAITLAPALAGAATHREEGDQTIDLAGIKVLRVENARGEIDVRPGPAGSLRMTAIKIARASNSDQARGMAAATRVESERKDDTYEIKVHYSQQSAVRIGWRDLLRGHFEPPRTEVRLTLQVPAGMALRLRSASGDLSILDLTGPLTLESSSGDVTLISSRGPVEIKTSSGDVMARDTRRLEIRSASGSLRLENPGGPVAARTTSGSISVRGATDTLFVRSVSGDIDVDQAPRGLTANSSSGSIDARGVALFADVQAASGDIDIGFVRPLERAEVSTVTGRISGRLADKLACLIDLRTSSGDLEVLMPLKLRSVSRREVVGVINGGKAPIVMQTSAGDIELMSGGE
jgi:hypothetical protein